MSADVADWTQGEEGIAYQACRCGHVQYFRRGFCAECGAPAPDTRAATGQGVVYSLTRVHRAATEAARAHVPYTIVLVEMAEGFRVMAHGASDLAIGDAVCAQYETFAGRIVPHFKRMS
jgi:uncharacterized OB-fold protein